MSRTQQLLRRHGTTYWWGTLLLSREQAADVAAVYAVCRVADDLVDEFVRDTEALIAAARR